MKIRLILAALTLCIAVVSLNARTLVVYYSYTNNVEKIVNTLSSQIDCDVVEIQPAEKGLDYAANNYAIGSAQISAIRNNPDKASSYPAIDPVKVNLDDYDTIIIGAPLWWSQMAAPLQTYLFNNGKNMAGKNIGLIVSSHSSGISGVVADAGRLIPEGKFLEPALWVRSSEVTNCRSKLTQWLRDIDYSNLSASVEAPHTDEIAFSCSSGLLNVTGRYDMISLFDRAGIKVGQSLTPDMNISSLSSGLYILCVATPAGNKSFKIRLD